METTSMDYIFIVSAFSIQSFSSTTVSIHAFHVCECVTGVRLPADAYFFLLFLNVPTTRILRQEALTCSHGSVVWGRGPGQRPCHPRVSALRIYHKSYTSRLF